MVNFVALVSAPDFSAVAVLGYLGLRPDGGPGGSAVIPSHCGGIATKLAWCGLQRDTGPAGFSLAGR